MGEAVRAVKTPPLRKVPLPKSPNPLGPSQPSVELDVEEGGERAKRESLGEPALFTCLMPGKWSLPGGVIGARIETRGKVVGWVSDKVKGTI